MATSPVTRLTTVATAIELDARANDGPDKAARGAGEDADGAAAVGVAGDTDGRPDARGSWFIGGTPTSTPPHLTIVEAGAQHEGSCG